MYKLFLTNKHHHTYFREIDTSAYIDVSLKERYMEDKEGIRNCIKGTLPTSVRPLPVDVKIYRNRLGEKDVEAKFLAGGSSGRVFEVKIGDLEFAIKVVLSFPSIPGGPFIETNVENECIHSLTEYTGVHNEYAAWFIDRFSSTIPGVKRVTYTIMMKADGTLSKLYPIDDAQIITIMKHALMSLHVFHAATNAVHRDVTSDNFLVFNKEIDEVTFRDVQVPPSSLQVILYDFGEAMKGETSTFTYKGDYIMTMRMFSRGVGKPIAKQLLNHLISEDYTLTESYDILHDLFTQIDNLQQTQTRKRRRES